MNSALNKEFHAELSRRGLMDQKPVLVSSFTNGRTEHSSEMSDSEARELINHLRMKERPAPGEGNNGYQHASASDRMRKKILSCCHNMQWYQRQPSGNLLLRDGKPQLDFARIDAYCVKYSPQHKPLQKHTPGELSQLVTIFQNVLKSHNKKQTA